MFGHKEVRILMCGEDVLYTCTLFYKPLKMTSHCYCSVSGLDGAGKTTVLYKMKLEEIATTLPTTGKLCIYVIMITY